MAKRDWLALATILAASITAPPALEHLVFERPYERSYNREYVSLFERTAEASQMILTYLPSQRYFGADRTTPPGL